MYSYKRLKRFLIILPLSIISLYGRFSLTIESAIFSALMSFTSLFIDMKYNLDQVEKYIKTGELTDAGYKQLKSHIYYILTNSNWHYHFGIPLEELINDILSNILPAIGKHDASKGMILKSWIQFLTKRYIYRRHALESTQKRNKKKVISLEEPIASKFSDGDNTPSQIEYYSFHKAMEKSVFAHEDSEFVRAVLLYWTLNVDEYFYNSGRLYAARKIIDVLLSGRTYERMSYGRFIKDVLKLNSRQAFHQVLNVMRMVNKELHRKWINDGCF